MRVTPMTFAVLMWGIVAFAAAPGPPTGLAATVNGNVVSLAWQAPSTGTPAGYLVEATLSPGGAVIASVPIAQTSLVVPGFRMACITCASARSMRKDLARRRTKP